MVDVPKGSGSKGKAGKTDCILYPRPPINHEKQIWYFSIDSQDPVIADKQYQNLVLLFQPEQRGPQDSYLVEFSMNDTAIDDSWKFIPPGIEFKERDENHDIDAKITANGKKLLLRITFNEKQNESLEYYFTAEYKGKDTTSKDPIMVIGVRPPRL